MKFFLSFVFISLLFSITVDAQKVDRINDASTRFDVDLKIENCPRPDASLCGPITVRFFRRNAKRHFQTIRLPRTDLWDNVPKANVIKRYDDQSTINFGDFNFDGIEDVAICDGNDGGYFAPSYRVYLYSGSQKRFVYSRAFTRMNEGGLGMFETDSKRKLHYVFTKSTCCWHQTQGFDVVRGRPRLVYEFTEAIPIGDPSIVEITTAKLIRGKWRTWTKHAKTADYYHE